MNHKQRHPRRSTLACALGIVSLCGAPAALAQNAPPPSAGSAPAPAPAAAPSGPGLALPGGGGLHSANPYYVGASQAFTHDSNVYRIPDGPADTYSTTSLLGGFDQRIGRQRVFGSGHVSDNRYFDQDQLNNVSYGLAAGLDWETIQNLSGNIDVGLDRSRTAPAATSASTAHRNIATSASVDARARWGGRSLFTLEGALGYSKIHYSAPESAPSNSSQDSGGLTLFYRPGGPLRLGIGGRLTRTRSPQALFDPATGEYQSNTTHGRNLDFLVDYDLTGLLGFNGRLSYTDQTNSAFGSANFSGLTGSAALVYRVTGKTTLTLQASRDAGYDSSLFNSFVAVQNGQSVVVTPVVVLFENNRVTDSIGVGANYAATAKIAATAGARYNRAKLLSAAVVGSGNQALPESTDIQRTAYVGATYAIRRNVNAACNLSYESRSVSGAFAFHYTDTSIGCSAQLTWP
jgi:hypothetical protein